MPEVTNHGASRARKRLGLNKKTIEKEFVKALAEGKRQADFKGAFRKYLDFWCREYKSTAYVYHNAIYLVKVDTLITVWAVPGKFKKYL